MIRSSWLRAAPVAALVLAVPACKDDGGPTGPSGTPDHEVSFTYGGDRTGAFQAQGQFPGPAAADANHWAAGVDFTGSFGSGELFGVVGHRAVGGGVSDVFTLAMSQPPLGEVICNELTVSGGGCRFEATLAQGVRANGTADVEFVLVAGRMTVTEKSRGGSGRLTGTFAVTLRDLASGDEIEIQNGSFDVDLRDPDEFDAAVASATRIPPRFTLPAPR